MSKIGQAVFDLQENDDRTDKKVGMIRHADVLAFCRAYPTTEEVISMLSALTTGMHDDNPAGLLLGACNNRLMDFQEAQRISEMWTQDDKDCRRAQALMFGGVTK